MKKKKKKPQKNPPIVWGFDTSPLPRSICGGGGGGGRERGFRSHAFVRGNNYLLDSNAHIYLT